MKKNCNYRLPIRSLFIIGILSCFLFFPSLVVGQKDKTDNKEMYTLIHSKLDNVIIQSVYENESGYGYHDFVGKSFDEENNSLIPQYYLLHVTCDQTDKIDINPGKYNGSLQFGKGVYTSRTILSIPVIHNFKEIKIMDVDVSTKVQIDLKPVDIKLQYSQISDACLLNAQKLYAVIRPTSNDELMMFDAATGKLKSIIELPLDNTDSITISDIKRKEGFIFLAGISLSGGDVSANWVAKIGTANRIQNFYSKISGVKRLFPPQFVESKKGVAIVNNRQEFSHKAGLVLFDANLKVNDIIDLDCGDRLFSSSSIYGLCDSMYITLNRFKKNGTRNNLRFCINNGAQLLHATQILNTNSRIYNKAFLINMDKNFLITTNFTTILEDRKLRRGIGIKKIHINKKFDCH